MRPQVSRCIHRRRGAASLIEVVVAITLTAVLFGTTVTLSALLFHLEQLGREELASTITQGRLASDFRSDVHAALRLDPTSEADRLVLLGPGNRTVTYRWEGRSLIRERLEAGGPGRTEAYRLRPGTLVRWEQEESASGRRLTLILEVPPSPNRPSPVSQLVRIEAAIGRDHRFGSTTS